MSSELVAIGFAILWLTTFFPAWYLLLRLVAISSQQRLSLTSLRFISYFVVYQLIIALPYVFVLVFGDEVPQVFKLIAYSVLAVGFVVTCVRLLFGQHVEKLLWYIYGFVYDGLLNFYPYVELINTSVAHLKIDESSDVLDLGAGTGNGSIKINMLNPSHIDVVDGSSSMLRKARKKLKPHANYSIVHSDIDLFLKRKNPGTYNRVLMINVLYALHDREKVWKLLYDQTSLDTRVAMTSSDRGGSKQLIRHHLRHDKLIKLFHPKLIAVFVIDTLISAFAKDGVFHFIDAKDMKLEAESAGWAVENIGRTYGDKINGVNVLFILTKPKQKK